MGVFLRGDPAARGRAEGERILRQAGEREQRAARSMAAKAGYDVSGAEHVAYEAPRTHRCLVVRSDRVDLYDRPGDADEPTHETIWRRDLVDVVLEEGNGLLAGVEVVGPDTRLRVEIPRTQARLLHRLLTDLGPAPAPAPAAAPTRTADGGSHLELLRQLAAMRDEGLVTEEEFTAKKAEILARM